MRDVAILLVVCATACAPRAAFVDTGSGPIAPCGAGIECSHGGGTGSLLVPAAALVAVAVFFTVALFTDNPFHSSNGAPP